MAYAVKEIFYTLQGEGTHAGRASVFCRFAGCNLWNGLEKDRNLATCQFCDTDFVGTDGTLGNKYRSAEDLATTIASLWPTNDNQRRWVVVTGGEPLLQVDTNLINALHAENFEIAVETNGTIAVPKGIDWICVSPKAGAELIQRRGHELKLVFPQLLLMPDQLPEVSFEHYALQPMDGPKQAENTQKALAYCLDHPKWRLCLQQHKLLGIR